MSPVHVKYSTIHDEVSVTLPFATSPRTPWVRRGAALLGALGGVAALCALVRSPVAPASPPVEGAPLRAELPGDVCEAWAGQADEIIELPGPFRQFSGFLAVGDRRLFYYLAEADRADDGAAARGAAPLVWLNGGPGCSSSAACSPRTARLLSGLTARPGRSRAIRTLGTRRRTCSTSSSPPASASRCAHGRRATRARPPTSRPRCAASRASTLRVWPPSGSSYRASRTRATTSRGRPRRSSPRAWPPRAARRNRRVPTTTRTTTATRTTTTTAPHAASPRCSGAAGCSSATASRTTGSTSTRSCRTRTRTRSCRGGSTTP